MKLKIDIDCTPEEARQFLGLPDIRKMQERLVQEMEAQLLNALRAADPETLVKNWLPTGLENLERWQKMFWQGFDNNKDKK